MALADLPSIEVLRAKLLGVLLAPGDEAGDLAQYAREPTGAGLAGARDKGA